MEDIPRKNKMYLIIGMSVLGGIILITLNAFRVDKKDDNPTISKGNIVSKQTNFDITLDTLSDKDRNAFYRKQREKDTILLADPFTEEKQSESDEIISELTKYLEEDKITLDNDSIEELLRDSENVYETDLKFKEEVFESEAQRKRKILEANQRQKERFSSVDNTDNSPSISINAAIYRDQFILPGDLVEVITTKDAYYNDKIIPKNTIVFAQAAIKENRVLLRVNNINHVPLALTATDYNDGIKGIRSKRAGELWREAAKEAKENITNDLTVEASQETGRIGRSIGRAIVQLFRKKRYKKKDKILLIGDHPMILKNETK